MIDVVWLNPSGLDQLMLHDLFDGKLWSPVNGVEFNQIDGKDLAGFDEVKGHGAIVVVPGGYQDVNVINDKIFKLDWVLVIIISDENNLFPTEKLSHPNMKLWVQYPRTGRDYGDARFFGAGYAEARKFAGSYTKYTNVFVSGQDTHERRTELFDILEKYANIFPALDIHVNRTKGFTQGFPPEDYYKMLESARIAPAPSGTTTPDSFRVYEALELGVIPIADDLSPRYDSMGYWSRVFPDAPFPILQDSDIMKIVDQELSDWLVRSNEIFAWWIARKRQYAYDLLDDLNALDHTLITRHELKDQITVVIPVSVWKSHPHTYILDETIKNAQAQLPGAEIIVTFDGVREEQMDRFDAYQEFVRVALWKINTEYHNVLPIIFKEHSHQAKMMREALKHVKTPTVLYNEGDSPLYANRRIDWSGIIQAIAEGSAHIVRLYNKEIIPPEHDYLMRHDKDMKIGSDMYVGTRQWSQQPHIASTEVYKRIMTHFTDDAICYIEDRIYYIIASGAWREWKMFIYKPDDEPRSYHLDGRSGAPKFDDKQIF